MKMHRASGSTDFGTTRSRYRRSRPQSSVMEGLESRTLLASTLPPGFEITKVINHGEGLDWLPMSQTFSPDGRLFITEKNTGRIRIVKNDRLLPQPFLELDVDTYNERGMNRIAFDPNFNTNGYVYVYYTRPDPSNRNVGDNNARNRVSRFRVDPNNPDRALAGSELVLLDDIPSTGNHNGGAMEFGADGKLYLATGDSFVSRRAQDLGNLAGKVLRINRNGSIPDDNPFVGRAGARPEIWAYGLRNPWTGTMKPGTNLFYVNDVGERTYEEINVIRKGKNYGWPEAEGPSSNPAYTSPVYYYDTGVLGAITGGAFYTASQFPEQYHGKYFFADYEQDFIRVLDPQTNEVRGFALDQQFPADVDVGPDGSLYVLTIFLGEVYKISYTGTDNRAPVAKGTAEPMLGKAPFEVDFDGRDSSDPDGDALTYEWDFGNGDSATGAVVSYTYDSPGVYAATLTVSDGRGGSNTQFLIIGATENEPQRRISVTTNQGEYRAGDVIRFSGSARDVDGNSIAAEAFQWTINFHHRDHFHPVRSDISGVRSGKFTIPDLGEIDHKVFYRITLTVNDAFGSFSRSADVKPVLSKLRLRSNVRGLALRVEGRPLVMPTNLRTVEGMQLEVSAPKRQRVNGVVYEFASWSDGGKAAHRVVAPSGTGTFRARYRTVTTARVKVKPEADTFVRDGSAAGRNYGNKPLLLADQKGAIPYLRFDLGDIEKVTRARLKLFGAARRAAGEGIRVAVYGSDAGAWDQSDLTWNNKGRYSRRSPVDVATIRDDVQRNYTWDVTSLVKKLLRRGQTQLTLVLENLDGGSTIVAFHSSEAPSRKPVLIMDAKQSDSASAVSSLAAASSFGSDSPFAVGSGSGRTGLYESLRQAMSEDEDLVLIGRTESDMLHWAP